MKNYLKNGKSCIECLVRKKLILLTPEEAVRQNFIKLLINKYKIPVEQILVEYPLSKIKKGKRGRVDILVFGINERGKRFPLILVECKAPNILISNSVILSDSIGAQLNRYSDVLSEYTDKMLYVIATNEKESKLFVKTETEIVEIEEMPIYPQILDSKVPIEKEYTVEKLGRRNHLGDLEDNYDELYKLVCIGEDTDKSSVPLLTNLVELLYDQEDQLKHLNVKNRKLVKDGGIRVTNFGNSGGGGYGGNYRYFILEDDNKEADIISLSIMAKAKTVNHKHWGNSKGITYLLVAIDSYERSHLSLQLSIDKYVLTDGTIYEFWHDGTLTAGSKGPVKRQVVIDFIKERSPKLVKQNRIFLGALDNSKVFSWQNTDIKDFISNVIEYSFIRDEIRDSMKK